MIRAILKLVAFWLWTLGMFAAGQGVALFLTERAFWRWRGVMFGAWARGAGRVLGMRVRSCGTPPPAASVLVANHLSYVDIIALVGRMDCTFVAKSEVTAWPVLGFICRRLRTIFVNRNQKRDLKRTLDDMQRALDNGVSVIFFPEGTSTAGDAVVEFKPSLLEIAAQQARPVHYAALRYATPADGPPARDAVCWWGDMTFPDHFFNLLKLRGFRLDLAFGAQPVQATERKELARQLWQQVSAQLASMNYQPQDEQAISDDDFPALSAVN
jgi:1-acyl-sn-glycerol-3-phosphate acyltransferase